MKKFLWLLATIGILLAGCGQQINANPLHNYSTKTFLLAFENLEEDIDQAKEEFENGDFSINQISTFLTIANEKKFITFLAERDLKYHFQYGSNQTIASAFSGTTNLSYNISYLVNLPAKIKANYRFNKALVNGDVEGELSSMVSSFLSQSQDISFMILMLTDIFYIISGALLAFIMLFLGTVIGFFTHPIQTFTDLPGAIMNLLFSLKSAWTNFFEW